MRRRVISKLGLLLINSSDSKAVVKAIRKLARTRITQSVSLSQDTIDKIKVLNDE